MKRLHVHVRVADLDRSIAFYSGLFGTGPGTTKSDYAKWMLEDPRVNFAISHKPGSVRGIEHLGIQVEDGEELVNIYAALKAAGGPVLEEGAATCCYAKSEKNWIADPDGVVWEAFLTHGDATVYGDNPGLEVLAPAKAAEGSCCVPATQPARAGCSG